MTHPSRIAAEAFEAFESGKFWQVSADEAYKVYGFDVNDEHAAVWEYEDVACCVNYDEARIEFMTDDGFAVFVDLKDGRWDYA